MLAWPFKPNLVIHSLPPGPQVLLPGRARRARPPVGSRAASNRSWKATRSCTHACEGTDASGRGQVFDCFSVFLASALLSPTAHLPSISPLSFQTQALFLPALSQLPAPALITPENVTHSQPSQTNTEPAQPHTHTHTFSSAVAALKGRFLTSALLPQVPAEVAGGTSPTWAKSVNGLIHYEHECLHFTACRGTIKLEWPSVFLFMYLFI